MHRHPAAVIAVVAISLGLAACGRAAASGTAAAPAGSPAAPEFPPGLDWLNTAAPLTMASLRGKVVLLDFWTYGCINCIHDFPWIRKLEVDFPATLVVVGVHSAKFAEEGATRNLREIVLRYGIDYPVVNDNRFEVWNEWGVNAWPTLALVDPAGNVVTERAGEGFYPEFKRLIASLVEEYGAKGMLDRRPLALKLEKDGLPQTVLSFPGKVRVDPAHDRIFISDTDHDRIVAAALDSGQVEEVIGSGREGFENGGFATAEFHHPQGTALSADGTTLYVADTGNNSLRAVNLVTRRVTTLDGTGEQAEAYPPPGGTAPDVALSSPWDLAVEGSDLYIAMAGSHQIWSMNLRSGRIGPLAGTGAEGYEDGPLDRASLAQPSGLTIGPDGTIYVADSEGSTIRAVDLIRGEVRTVAGADGTLFGFGYRDGRGKHARFQHPLGVVAYGGKLYVADTYNNRIRVVDPATGEVTTLCGGEGGWRDGARPLFYEPGGIDAAAGVLYVADTNNHSIRKIDLATGATSTLVLKGVSRLAAGDAYGERTVRLPAQTVRAGKGSLKLAVELPEGFAPNPQAPSDVTLSTDSPGVIELSPPAAFHGPGPRFPMTFPATFAPGSAEVTVGLSLVYCREVNAGVCMISRARLVVPVRVTGPAGSSPQPVVSVTDRIR